eukprot:m.87789 g.87789  ORF g.87789 m.87789 type:complete len:135 (+) comp15144_c0_seq4:464-868(+)
MPAVSAWPADAAGDQEAAAMTVAVAAASGDGVNNHAPTPPVTASGLAVSDPISNNTWASPFIRPDRMQAQTAAADDKFTSTRCSPELLCQRRDCQPLPEVRCRQTLVMCRETFETGEGGIKAFRTAITTVGYPQ